MKLVIWTQIEENYGAHDWDGTGECPQYWKPKYGSVFVVKNLSKNQAEKINQSGIPTLNALLTANTESFREYINGWHVVEDDAQECEEWESPIYLTYNTIAKAWKAARYQKNDGCFVRGIVEKIERWTLAPKGEQTDYMCYYRLTDGSFASYETLEERMKLLEVAAA